MSKYESLGAEIGRLVETKQLAYGDSFGKAGRVLRELYPEGVKPEQYDDLLAITRIVDKLFRIATDRDALGESPYRDVVGYGLLGAAKSGKPTAEPAIPKFVVTKDGYSASCCVSCGGPVGDYRYACRGCWNKAPESDREILRQRFEAAGGNR